MKRKTRRKDWHRKKRIKPKSVILLLLAIIIVFFAARSCVYTYFYPLKYEEYLISYSKEYGVDPYIIMAMIKTESRFDKNAESQQGAVGLMQLTRPTAEWIAQKRGDKEFNTSKLYDPETNIKMGIWYYKNLVDEFGNNELALAAYNAGRGNVNEWLSNADNSRDGKTLTYIPFTETRNYVKKVITDEHFYRIFYKF